MENYFPYVLFVSLCLLGVWLTYRRHRDILKSREAVALQLADVDKVVCRDVSVRSSYIGVLRASVSWTQADVTFLENSMVCFFRHRVFGIYYRALQLYRKTPGEGQVLPGRFVYPIESIEVKGQDLIIRYTFRFGLSGRSTLSLKGVAAMSAVKQIWRLE